MRIALFFSYSTSLQDWLNAGFICRELKPFYDLSLQNGYKFYLITYGDETDFNLDETYLKKYNIEVKPLKAFHGFQSIRNLCDIFSTLFKIDLVFSLQTTALISALPVSFFFNKPLISRSGYDVFAFSRNSTSLFKKSVLRFLELFASLTASAFIFATHADSDSFLRRTNFMRSLKNKIFSKKLSTYILPNWVNTNLFTPSFSNNNILNKHQIDFFSIGRLEPQKNYLSLLSLLASTNYNTSLTIAGSGSQFSALKNLSNELSFDLTLLGKVEHSKLPDLINQYHIYIQNSLIEGNPKSVLEAMSCGAIVMCRDSPGISQLIDSKQNGYLYNSYDFHIILSNILSNPNLKSLKDNARKNIVDNYNYLSYIDSLHEILKSSFSRS